MNEARDGSSLPLSLAVAPVIALFGTILAGVLTLGFSGDLLLAALLFAAFAAGLVARRRGKTFAQIQVATGARLGEALPAVLILLSIGALLGSWMFSGTIPLMVLLGLDLIDPRMMALTAFLATALMSIISGTSWGSAGTIGVALMGAAEAMGLPLAPIAGAVLSGAYFGDKLSPLSDMTNMAAIGAGADLYKHIRWMLWTSLPPAGIGLILYAALGFMAPPNLSDAGTDNLMRDAITRIFDMHPVTALPLVVAAIGIAMRRPPALVIIASSVTALLIGIIVQDFPVSAAIAAFVSGFDVTAASRIEDLPDAVTRLLNRGGLFSMAQTLIFIIAAFLLAAAMEVSGALDSLLRAMLVRVRTAFGLMAATLAAGATMVAMTSHSGVTSLIVGGLFRDSYAARDLAPENLSRAIEDSATVLEPLMPWTVSAVFMATTLGVSTIDYLPWAPFCYLAPVFALGYAAAFGVTGWGLMPKSKTP